MRLVLDCNVLIAAGWNAGLCRKALFEAIRNHTLFVFPKIIEEYARVIAYPEFDRIYPILKTYCSGLIESSILQQPYLLMQMQSLPEIENISRRINTIKSEYQAHENF